MHNLYDIVVPPLVNRFRALDQILTLLTQHCETHKVKEDFFINDRLYPDMLPLSSQVRIATDMAKGAVGRLTVLEIPKFEDNETTITELQARLRALIDFFATLNAEAFNGAEDKIVTVKRANGEVALEANGWDYVQNFVLPNVYFHLATAYNILRHRGVVLGKKDFIGRL